MSGAGVKRSHDENNERNEPIPKKCKLDLTDETRLENFNEWMIKCGFKLNKVLVTKKGVCSGWGMVASDNIKSGEVIFTIPRSVLLTPENSGLGDVVSEAKDELQSASGWVPLMVTLLHECTREDSKWRPYLDMVPDFNDFDMLMFWNEGELTAELQGTSIKNSIERDLSSLTEEFKSVVLPFVLKHPSLFDLSKITLEFFKKMVAFVMAYSFTEPLSDNDDDDDESDEEDDKPLNPPMMVPLADILNHVSNNNAHLQYKKDSLDMVATTDIQRGDEIFNTYGYLSNGHLLHMYGYAEEPTSAAHDSVDMSASELYNILVEAYHSNEAFMQKKWMFLIKNGCIPSDGHFVVGLEGVLTEENLLETFKVMLMSEEEFSLMEEKDGWMSDEEDDDNGPQSLLFENIPKLDVKIRQLLHKWTVLHIQKFPRKLEDEEKLIMGIEQNPSQMTKRKLFAAYVRSGQLQILGKLKECTKYTVKN